jgi:esterase/lipase superfamily enzyme
VGRSAFFAQAARRSQDGRSEFAAGACQTTFVRAALAVAVVSDGLTFHSSFPVVEIRNMAYCSLVSRGDKSAYLLSLPAVLVMSGLAIANPPPATTSRPGDQVWLISCRSVSYNRHDDDLQELQYSVHRATSGWTAASQGEFLAAAPPSTTTCVLVLGNGYSAPDTRTLGQTAYRRLTTGLPLQSTVRFVIWSWPSDHIDAGPIKDLRAKSARTPHVAYCLARWLDEGSGVGRVSLLGTSFGARIVMEALELRGGGRVGNLRLEGAEDVTRPKVKVALISAAIDSDWLLPGRRLAHAVSQTDGLLLVNNMSDDVLKRYHWLYGPRSKAAALGVTGLRGTWQLGEEAEKIQQLDASSIIGRHHGCGPYFESPRLVAAMRSHLFSDAAKTPDVPTDGLPIPVATKPGQEASSVKR